MAAMSVFHSGLDLYRRTIKRIRPAHTAVHQVMRAFVLPALERMVRFRTIADDPFWFRLELLTGRHERATVTQALARLAPAMTVLDVGAHVGYYSRRFAERVGPAGRVLAFEPHPRTFAVLQENVRGYPQVTTEQMAVAEGEGSAQLYDYLMMSASGSLHYDESMAGLQQSQIHENDIAPRLREGYTMQTYSVATRAIDAVCHERGITQVDLIKMDIEGAELMALRGARAVIASSPTLTLIMEYNPAALRSFGHDPAAALQEIREMGFVRCTAILDDGTLEALTDAPERLADLTQSLEARMGVVNLMFTR
jgi:FkbM family methyltransferase